MSAGGHLTHGAPVSFSGKTYNFVAYNVDKEPADKEPTVEINNYYGETTKAEVNNSQELSHKDIQKMIKLLEEIDKQNEESNRMKDQSNP